MKVGNAMFKYVYIICTVLSMYLFYLCNNFTEQLVIKDDLAGGGGNGNPGLFPWLFLLPFFLGFLLGTFIYLLKWIRRLKKKSIYYILFSSLVLSSIIVIITYKNANNLRERIIEVHPSFTNAKQIDLLNTFSNDIFFNPYTFILVILMVLFLSSIFIAIKKSRD